MTRFILCVMLILSLGGTLLYMTKLSVDNRYDELERLQASIKAGEQRSAILTAEWGFLSRPQRLMTLSTSLLSMRPLAAHQIMSLDQIAIRPSLGASLGASSAPSPRPSPRPSSAPSSGSREEAS